MQTKHITLADIANRLNVTTVTVSKALRGHPDISPQTAKLIVNVATELGYSPRSISKKLSSKKSNTIGVVLPEIAHHFFSAMIEHIYEIAFDNHYEIMLTVSQENSVREYKHIQTLRSMKVAGIIISISQQTSDYEIFKTLRDSEVPLVFVDRIPYLQNVNTVTVDDYGGAYKAIKHAVGLGYRKIAFFAGKSYISIGKERVRGFIQALTDSGIEVNSDWVIEAEFNEQSGYDSLMQLHNNNNLPEMILTIAYPVAIGVYRAARELNLRIPEDIDIICFGNSPVQEFLNPPLSCIDQPTKELAVKSMDLLFDNIAHKESYQPKQIVIDTDLIIRGTCNRYNRG